MTIPPDIAAAQSTAQTIVQYIAAGVTLSVTQRPKVDKKLLKRKFIVTNSLTTNNGKLAVKSQDD